MEFDINQPMNFYKDIQNNIYQILTKGKTYNVSRKRMELCFNELRTLEGFR